MSYRDPECVLRGSGLAQTSNSLPCTPFNYVTRDNIRFYVILCDSVWGTAQRTRMHCIRAGAAAHTRTGRSSIPAGSSVLCASSMGAMDWIALPSIRLRCMEPWLHNPGQLLRHLLRLRRPTIDCTCVLGHHPARQQNCPRVKAAVLQAQVG